MTFTAATLALAEMAGAAVIERDYCSDVKFVGQKTRYVVQEEDGGGVPFFRPWLSLDDCAELERSLDAEVTLTLRRDRKPTAFTTVRGRSREAVAPTEALARFKALCLALGLTVEGGG